MAALYMHSYAVRRNVFPGTKGYQYAADIQIELGGAGYTTIVLTVLWNAKKTLVRGTTGTETVVTDANVSISKAGASWGTVADIPGDDAWVSHANTVIRFRKRFTVELPVAPALSKIPIVGEVAKDLGATATTRIEVGGVFDVVSYAGKMKTTIF